MKQQEKNLPYYLGFNSLKGSYHFFLSLPDGTGRVLTYVSYFYLDKGLDGSLDTKVQPTEEMKLELKNYLSGKISYVFKKLRKNSKEQTVFKLPSVTLETNISPVEYRTESGSDKKRISTRDKPIDRSNIIRLQPAGHRLPGDLLVGDKKEDVGPVILKRRGRKPGSKNKPKPT